MNLMLLPEGGLPDGGPGLQTRPTPEQFDLQPVLTGKLVTLRPLRPEDWPELFAVASDPLVWEQHPASDRCQEHVFRGFFREALESGGALVVLDAADGRIIGSSRFNRYNQEQSEIEIGWTFLARSHWGGAHNGEMKSLMLGHAFRFVTTVVFYVGQTNMRSQKALEEIGAIRVGFRIDSASGESAVYEIKKPSA
jgi:RimJ/RimL family protein N-acetyltransferase